MSAPQRTTIRAILEVITGTHPDLQVVIAWNHPQVKSGDTYVFGISAAKSHLLIAPWDAAVLEEFRPRLTHYVVNKKTIRIPDDWDIDAGLLRDMIAACLARLD